MKFRTLLCLSALVVSLAACGGPSDSEVQSAISTQLAQAMNLQKQLVNLAGSLFGQDTRENSRKIDSTLAGARILVGDKNKLADGSYSVVVTVKMNDESHTSTVRMIKAADGWVIQE